MTVRRRASLLLALAAAGAVVGALVRWAWGSDAGFLAVPGLMALAWLFVADPTRCDPRDRGQ